MSSSKIGAITVVLFLFVLPYTAGSQTSTDQWASLVVQYYIDTDNENAGYCPEPYDGWDIKYDSRAPRSMMKSQGTPLEPRIEAAISAAFAKDTVPEGIKVPPASATVWTIEGGSVVVTFEARAVSGRTETADVWDESLDKLVPRPAYANLLSAALWVRGDAATIIQHEGQSDADLETYFFAVDVHDVVDLDLDGDPEVVLHERAYERESLNVFTVGSGGVTERIRLQGCSL
jgi:hypothetical protein